jgi:hypothetical protein
VPRIIRVMALATALFLAASVPAGAVTVEQVIKLKKAGVSDQTIQMLIDREGLAISAEEVKRLKATGVDDKTIRLILILRQKRYEDRQADAVRKVITHPDGSQEVVITSGGPTRRPPSETVTFQRRQAWRMLQKMIIVPRLRR